MVVFIRVVPFKAYEDYYSHFSDHFHSIGNHLMPAKDSFSVYQIDDILIQIIRKPIKNICLRIHRTTAQATVSVPLKLSLEFVKIWLESRRDWLIKARAAVIFRNQALSNTLQEEQYYFLGIKYPLVLSLHHTFQGISIQDNAIHGLLAHDSLEQRRAYLAHWYKQQMENRIPSLIKKWEPIIGVRVREWRTRTMNTRWGSCNVVAHRIWLNVKLMEKPLICLEYVLVHEMIHLHEANHSKRFYALMDKFMPNWKQHKQLLDDRSLATI